MQFVIRKQTCIRRSIQYHLLTESPSVESGSGTYSTRLSAAKVTGRRGRARRRRSPVSRALVCERR
eukprot:229980-Pleurochrysis_carterae.AAC.1